jgi:N-hydroxyarylamine O-acetyltransferase
MIDLDAYFARIGYTGPRKPTLETLEALQSLHPSSIPFEAIDVLLGRNIRLSTKALEEKLVKNKRGGYCFEQNNLFKSVLSKLGFEVEGLIGRVSWLLPKDSLPRPRTHMALRVTIEGTAWLVDVGFGSVVPTKPLRWNLGEEQPTTHETYRLIEKRGGDTILEAQLAGSWTPVYELSQDLQYDVDYELANWYTSTYPDSRFRKELIVAHTTPQYRAALLENRFTIRSRKGEVQREFLTIGQLKQVLFDVFGLFVEPEWIPLLEKAVKAGESLAQE